MLTISWAALEVHTMSVNEIDAKCRGPCQLQNLIEEADAIKAALTAQG